MKKILGLLLYLYIVVDMSSGGTPVGRAIFADLFAANKSGTSEDLRWKYQKSGPVAAVLYCSDTGEEPATLFYQDKEALAVVKTAGNSISIAGASADSVEIGSLEYAVHYKGVPLIIVMGHTDCSVVDTLLKLAEADDHAPVGNLDSVFQVIRPAVSRAMKGKDDHGERLRLATTENVRNMANRLRRSRYMLGKLLDQGELVIVGCLYDVETGFVEEVR